MSEDDLVTVVIPAFNAARTIDETLRSVRSQTHRRLEILVVDDGSGDATSQIVERHAAEDCRIRLIQQANAGVAAARNRGTVEAAGDLVAPIDADDLWRPDKIEKQLAALRQGGAAVALVYTWSANVDENSRIINASPGPTYAGTVDHEICRYNFIGNGSAVLMRKTAILEAGGYDTSPRARSAEGVEDWQIYFRVATRHEFSVVPEHLTGYRRLPNAMSSNVLRMIRGRDLVAEEMCILYPERRAEIRRLRLNYLKWQYELALHTRKPAKALLVAALLLRQDPLKIAKHLFLMPTHAIAGFILRRLARRPRDEKVASIQAKQGWFLAKTLASYHGEKLQTEQLLIKE